MMPRHRLTRPETIRRVWVVFAIVLALTVLAEGLTAREAHFEIETLFGFNAWFGFLACAGLIGLAKLLGLLLKRADTYFDESGDD